jgi:hypothetical protein
VPAAVEGSSVELEHSRDRSTDATQRAFLVHLGRCHQQVASNALPAIDRALRPSLRSAVRRGCRRITPMEGRCCQPILNGPAATKMNGRPDLECGAP